MQKNMHSPKSKADDKSTFDGSEIMVPIFAAQIALKSVSRQPKSVTFGHSDASRLGNQTILDECYERLPKRTIPLAQCLG